MMISKSLIQIPMCPCLAWMRTYPPQDAHFDALSDAALSEVSDVSADKPWQPIIPEVSSFPACDDLQETVSVTLESLESDRAARLKLKAQKLIS